MGIISCPECSKDCSDKALACPHCGYPIVSFPKTDYLNLLEKRIEEVLNDKRIAVRVLSEDKILCVALTLDRSLENPNYYLLWMQISNLLTPDTLKKFSQILVTSTFENDINPSWQRVAEIDFQGKLIFVKVDDKNKNQGKGTKKIEIKPVYKAVVGVLVSAALISGCVGLFKYFNNIRSIPNLVDKSIGEAKITLEKQELKYEIVETELGNLPPDQVISQNPLVSTNSTKGSVVKLVVSKLPKLPKFFNLPVEDAQKILSDMKLSYEVTEKSTEAFEPRKVISQIPEPNTPIKEGDKVQLTIAKAPPPPVYTVRGVLTLLDSAIDYSTTKPLGAMSKKEIMALPCYGSGGYKDIQGGMTVKIQDGKQNTLALGSTELGYFDGSTVVCSFKFQVNNVPKSDFYTISVGNRGGINYSFDDMKNMGWNIKISLGY